MNPNLLPNPHNLLFKSLFIIYLKIDNAYARGTTESQALFGYRTRGFSNLCLIIRISQLINAITNWHLFWQSSGIESGPRYLFNEDVELYAIINYNRGEENDAGGVTVPTDRIPPLNGRVGFTFNPGYGLRLETYVDFAAEQDRLSPCDAAKYANQ
jgi:hypothetical protein